MFQPHELAAAMGFPKGYDFAGTKREKNKQIGNAVDVTLAEALCACILERWAAHKSEDWRKEAAS
jgi:DNA (cytosine-5)-methyltransferase 1